jgi:hypothetical protein
VSDALIFTDSKPREWTPKEWAFAIHQVNGYQEYGRLPKDQKGAAALKYLSLLLESHPCPQCFQTVNAVQAGPADLTLDPDRGTELGEFACPGCGASLYRVVPPTDGGRGWFWRLIKHPDVEAPSVVATLEAAEQGVIQAAVAWRKKFIPSGSHMAEDIELLQKVDEYGAAVTRFGR